MSTPPVSSGGFMSSVTVVGEIAMTLADSGGPGTTTTDKEMTISSKLT